MSDAYRIDFKYQESDLRGWFNGIEHFFRHNYFVGCC